MLFIKRYHIIMNMIEKKYLTEREREIVMLILSGKNKRKIAEVLSLSVSTIKTNVENIYRKFDVHNKVELIVFVIKNNIIDIDDT